jgi:DNA-3-methyladenine glycosylase II
MTPEAVAAARKALADLDSALARADAVTPPFEWRFKTRGFVSLVKIIVEQQVSTASADAIWARLEAGLGAVTPETVTSSDEARLKSFGLSSQKARYVRGVAEAQMAGVIDLDTLETLDDETAVARLVSLKGVGRWTAEAYLLGCEGRTDIFPAGDLALQEGLRLADGASARLGEKALYARAEAWRPNRGVAALLLWAYYRAVKRGEITPPSVGDIAA